MVPPLKVIRPPGADHPPLALLVDRNEDTRQMYAEHLRGVGCDVSEAGDGREALAKAIAGHPDVVVTETRLPGLSGFDLCTLLRQDHATRDVVIVVVTGDALAKDVEHARRVGADAVLVKPCLPDRLAEKIQELFSKGAELRQRSARVHAALQAQLIEANEALEQSQATVHLARQLRRQSLARAHDRHDTTTPPIPPPELLCTACDRPLEYIKSYIGGVSARHQEQWDYFLCPGGCGTFQYRQRTRRIRRIA